MSQGGDLELTAARRRRAGGISLPRITKLGLLLALVAALASACAAQPPPAATSARAAAPAGAAPAERATEQGDSEDERAPDAAEDAEGAPVEGSETAGPCPVEMVLVETAAPSPRRFCVDRYEGSLVELLADGTERPFSHHMPVDGHDVRAVSRPGVFPQGYISEVQAQDACNASGKRLCSHEEWKTACMGPAHTTFPYGQARRPGACHDTGKSAVVAVFGAKAVAASTPFSAPAPSAKASSGTTRATSKRAHAMKGRAAQTSRPRAARGTTKPVAKASARKAPRHVGKSSVRPASVDPGVWAHLNDPALGQVEGALSRTGEHQECVSGFGAVDMVGNLHEWVATDPAALHGTFAGGYYLDTAQNGDGCLYKTQAHAHEYHDYSTGFRCCASAGPSD